MIDPIRRQHGFTLVEMTVVVLIVAVLTGLASPGIFRSLRQASINGVAAAIKTAAEDAQARSMRAGSDVFAGAAWGDGIAQRYGVRVTPATGGLPASVCILHGDQAIGVAQTVSEAVDLRRWSSATPVPPITDTTDLVLMTASVEWWYDWHTGLPCRDRIGNPLTSNIAFTIATRDYQVSSDAGVIRQVGLAGQLVVYRRTGMVRAQ